MPLYVAYAPAGSTPTYADRKTLTSGNKTLNSTTWADVDTAIDITLSAKAGDFVEVGLSTFWGSENVISCLDVVSVVSAAPVKNWSENVAESASAFGVMAWNGPQLGGATNLGVGGSVIRPLAAGDISAGTVTLRLRYRTVTAANKSLVAVTDAATVFWARNHG